jgi:hypothetical protein
MRCLQKPVRMGHTNVSAIVETLLIRGKIRYSQAKVQRVVIVIKSKYIPE